MPPSGLAALALLASAGLAAAAPRPSEPLPAPAGEFTPAPWWMRTPIIAATGEVQTHVPANRASFSAVFSAVDPKLAAATRQAADAVRPLVKRLSSLGPETTRVETSLSITPLYQQYKDANGELQTNERADRITGYQASVRMSVEVRDVSALEAAYAAAVSARPASMQPVSFRLEPDNALNTSLFGAAVQDAARRGRLAAEAVGGRLGRAMLVDPTARACETDVLIAGAPRGLGPDAGGRREVVLEKAPLADFASKAAPAAEADDLLPLQPPLEALERRVCVIYALD